MARVVSSDMRKDIAKKKGALVKELELVKKKCGEEIQVNFSFDWDGLKRRESYSMAWARSRDDECSAPFLQSLRAFHRK